MKVAIYGRAIKTKQFKSFYDTLLTSLKKHGIEYSVIESFAEFMQLQYGIQSDICTSEDLISHRYDFLLSLGGDGTVLDTLALVKDSGIPVLGINLGRFGFLANIKVEEIDDALIKLTEGAFTIEGRSLISVDTDMPELKKFPFALNDFVVQKRGSSSMITVDTYLDDDFLNSYWSDGLIVATPTGSSGYSLSCGGPLLFPGSQGFVITPIAAHNLTVRPAVIPDNKTLKFEFKSRANSLLVSLDSRSYKIPANTKLAVKKAKFTFNMVRLHGNTYMDTIRTKLMWGMDSRNTV